MKLTQELNHGSFNQKKYDDGSVINDFQSMKVYYNPNTHIRIEYSKREFIIEQNNNREKLPDFSYMKDDQLFQYSTVFDVDSFIIIQHELKQ